MTFTTKSRKRGKERFTASSFALRGYGGQEDRILLRQAYGGQVIRSFAKTFIEEGGFGRMI